MASTTRARCGRISIVRQVEFARPYARDSVAMSAVIRRMLSLFTF